MEVKNVRKGKIIFVASCKHGSVEKLEVVSIEDHDLFSDGRLIKFMECKHFNSDNSGEFFITPRSMRDANIVPNGYNDYKTFFTPSAAYKYASTS